MNAHKQLDTSRILERRDFDVAPFVAAPRDFMPPQMAQSFDAMRERDRFVPSRTRHDLSVGDSEMYGTLGADELSGMERAVRDHFDTYDGGASRHSFGGTVAAPSGDSLGATQGSVGITRFGDAELSVARPTVRYPKEQSRTAETKEPSSRQYTYEPAQRVGDRVERAVPSVPECYKSHVRLSPRAEAAVATLRAMHGSATRVVTRHPRTSTPAPNKNLEGTYVSSGVVSYHRADDATIDYDRHNRSCTTRAALGDAPSARQADWHVEYRADREQIREAASLGDLHTVRQAHQIGNERETRVVMHEAPQFGDMHTVRQAHQIGNDRENRHVVHGAFDVGVVGSARLERPTLPTMSDRAGIAHRPSDISVEHSRLGPSVLTPRNERAGRPEQRAPLGHAPTRRLLGVHLESNHAGTRAVVQADLGTVESREDLVAREVDESTAFSSHLAPTQRQQHQVSTRIGSVASDRYDMQAPGYVNVAGRPRAEGCVRETLRIEPHHAAGGSAPPIAHTIRGRGRQQYDAR